MEKNRVTRFLEFNGKKLAALSADGQWWVAVKPICEALGVQFNWQHQRIQEHPILGQLSRNSEIVAADGKVREMFCLPERFIYGWLFSLQANSPELIEYQFQCYEVLYNHFHGTLSKRVDALEERRAINAEIEASKKAIADSEHNRRIAELQKLRKAVDKKLQTIDHELVTGQLSLDVESGN